MKISYACKTGSGHIEQGRPCEDSIAVYNDGSLFAAALSDGAGSKPRAKECSSLLTGKAIDYFSTLPFRAEYFDSAHFLEYILCELRKADLDRENAGATLLLFAACSNKFVCCHIGDGVILMQRRGDGVFVYSEPENGEYSNQTYFLPGDNAANHFRVYTGNMQDIECIIMASDGISDKLYELDTLVPAPVCEKISGIAQEASESQMNEILRTSLEELFSMYTADDMSIVVMRR